MKKILFPFILVLVIAAPHARVAVAQQDALGNTEFDCQSGGTVMFLEGNGHGEMTISNPRTFVILLENSPFLGFKRHGNIKWSDNFTAFLYPNSTNPNSTQLRLSAGATEGTVTFDGQNRVVVWGTRDDVRLSGNYSFITSFITFAVIPSSCP